MNNRTKKIINLLFLILIFNTVYFYKINRAEETINSSIVIKYQNRILDVNIKEASLKDIFEEMKKNTGINYILEKELESKVITINIKGKELLQGVEDILKEIGDLGYVVFYDKKDNNITSINIKGQSDEEEVINDTGTNSAVIDKLNKRIETLEKLVEDIKKEPDTNIVVSEKPAGVKQDKLEIKADNQINKNDWGINEGEIYSHVEIKIKTVTIDYFMNEKPAVKMDHKKHSETLKIECNKCHHKKKEGEKAEQTKCSDKLCHAKVQKMNGNIYDASKSSVEVNPYHISCMNCHKKYKDDSKKEAPTKCEGCHKKEKSRKRD